MCRAVTMPEMKEPGATEAAEKLREMPLLKAPSEEILELARELVTRGGAPPRARNELLQVAVSRVAARLDDHDRRLMRRVASSAANRWGETALVTAIARRITNEQSVVFAELAEARDPDEPSDQPRHS